VNLKVRYLGGHKFETSARGHTIISDLPADKGGSDFGMTPTELFLASVGSCAGYYASEYLRCRGLPDSDLEIHVSGSAGEHPSRFIELTVEVCAPGLNQRNEVGIQRAVKNCLILNSLLEAPAIHVKVGSSPVLAG
jgi:putative redox protein